MTDEERGEAEIPEADIPEAGDLVAGWRRTESGKSSALTTPRSAEAITARVIVLNALNLLAYDAPLPTIRAYLSEAVGSGAAGNDALSPAERELLVRESGAISPQEIVDAGWLGETLAAFLWIGGFLEELPLDRPCPEGLFTRLPDVEAGDCGEGFAARMRLRPSVELFAMLDRTYRAHAEAVAARRAGTPREGGVESRLREQRRALEWALDAESTWDEIDLST